MGVHRWSQGGGIPVSLRFPYLLGATANPLPHLGGRRQRTRPILPVTVIGPTAILVGTIAANWTPHPAGEVCRYGQATPARRPSRRRTSRTFRRSAWSVSCPPTGSAAGWR